jgi:hypothetical protein
MHRKLTTAMNEEDLEAAYRHMAHDLAREEEALDWSEALMEDLHGGVQACEDSQPS